MNYKIYQELDDIKTTYEGGSSEKISGLYRSPFQIIKMCEYYSNSRYMQSNPLGIYNRDPLGRDMPFYNIVNFRVSLAKTATDLDIKDIQIISDNPKHQVQSMLLNRSAYEWMKAEHFGATLNKMGSTRPKYGGYLLKKTMEDGKLCIDVVDWTKVYTDLTDIMGGSIVELHTMSLVALKKKDGVWDDIDDVLRAYKGAKKKDQPNKIDVFEITGEFAKSVFKNYKEEQSTDADEFEYSLQKYFIAEVGGKKFPLYGEELSGSMEDYYEYLSWEDQSLDLGRGVIEDSEEAQVWTNDAVVNEKNAMDLAGRVGIKTNSKKLGSNILEHDHGKIYELGQNEDINAFNLAPSALGQYQNQIEKWKVQANDATSSYNSQTGEQPPAGTPYSQTALLNQVGSKPFDYKREEWGIHLTKIFENWVIPYLIKKLKKPHTLVSSDFTDVELEKIDESIANATVNQSLVSMVLNDEEISPDLQQTMTTGAKDSLKKQGKKRYIEIPEKYFDDIEAKVTVVTTGEQKNKAVILQSLSTILQTVQASFNPTNGTFGVLEDPTLKKIFDEIVELSGTGISPVSLGKSKGAAGVTSPTSATPTPMATQQSQPLATAV